MYRLKKIRIVIYILLSYALIIFLFSNLIEKSAHIYPDYEKENIVPILSKNNLSYSDYKTLFYQTGLGRIAIDEIIKNDENYVNSIMKFQDTFFENINFICESNSIISREEHIVNNKGKYTYNVSLAPYHNGYIFLTKSSHTLGWRNGHAGIVVDEEKGQILESLVLGKNSSIRNIDEWKSYPNFIILRLKNSSNELLSNVASFADKNIYNIPYGITVGILSPKYSDVIRSTNCSHLVWRSFKEFGYDIDYNKGLIVTPRDISKSPELEIIQIYGVNPDNIWS